MGVTNERIRKIDSDIEHERQTVSELAAEKEAAETRLKKLIELRAEAVMAERYRRKTEGTER